MSLTSKNDPWLQLESHDVGCFFSCFLAAILKNRYHTKLFSKTLFCICSAMYTAESYCQTDRGKLFSKQLRIIEKLNVLQDEEFTTLPTSLSNLVFFTPLHQSKVPVSQIVSRGSVKFSGLRRQAFGVSGTAPFLMDGRQSPRHSCFKVLLREIRKITSSLLNRGSSDCPLHCTPKRAKKNCE